MTRFVVRDGVEARFGSAELGEVTDLDVGQFADPTDFGAQYYVFSHDVLKDLVRFVARPGPSSLANTLAELVLSSQGAEYRASAVCVSEDPRADGRVAFGFEVEHRAQVTASARDRHGVDCLATALLLDALRPEDQD
jgi:hypothetical protein